MCHFRGMVKISLFQNLFLRDTLQNYDVMAIASICSGLTQHRCSHTHSPHICFRLFLSTPKCNFSHHFIYLWRLDSRTKTQTHTHASENRREWEMAIKRVAFLYLRCGTLGRWPNSWNWRFVCFDWSISQQNHLCLWQQLRAFQWTIITVWLYSKCFCTLGNFV